MACNRLSNPSRSLGRQTRAASVNSRDRLWRWNRATPRWSSSALIWWLTAAGVTLSSAAAFFTLRWRATVSNARRAFKGGNRTGMRF